MRLSAILMVLTLLTIACSAPAPDQSSTNQNPRVLVSPEATNTPGETVATEDPIAPIVEQAVELREEKIYYLTLKFKKEEYLDPSKFFQNELAAEYREVVVGESTFNQYDEGDEVSSVMDYWGSLSGDTSLFTTYVVSVDDKKIESDYFYVTRQGVTVDLGKDAYGLALARLRQRANNLITVPYSGGVVSYLLTKPLEEYQFVERTPLVRYFVKVEVENETFTLDFNKHIRNSLNTHEIEFEVNQETYNKVGEFWDPQLSVGSAIIKGHLSVLHGKVIKKWTQNDPRFVLAKTADGSEFILPAKD